MAYNSFPYSDYHELNLDYLLNKAKAIEGNVEDSARSAEMASQKAALAYQQASASANSALASAQSAQASAQSAQASETSATQARAAAGDPKTFTAATQLTDPEKIYVYVGGTTATYTYGHFYYYSGGVWHDGGVYGTWTTDDALSPTSTNAVQNKVLKGNFDTLDSAVDLIVKGTTTYNTYVQGYRTQSDYYNVHAQSTRCTSADVYHVYAGDTVTISNIAAGTKCAILATPPNYDSGWKTADFTYTATADQIVFVECAASDDTADILPSAITTVLTIVDRASRVTENAEEISSLKSDLDDLINMDISFSVSGALNQTSGAVVANANYACTELIELTGIWAGIGYTVKSYNNIAVACLYNDAGAVIANVSVDSSTLIETSGIITNFNGARYIRFCTNVQNGYMPKLCYSSLKDIKVLGKTISVNNVTFSEHDQITNLINLSKCSLGYINGTTDGSVHYSTTMYVTDFIPLETGKQYYFNGNYLFIGYYAFYDSSKVYISGGGSGSGAVYLSSPFTPPAGTAYGRFTIVSQDRLANAWLCETNQMATKPADYAEKIKTEFVTKKPTFYDGNEISVFTKILCIGDSLTDGAFNESGGSRLIMRNRAFPAKLQALTGVECTNLGYAGYTAAQWYEAYENEDVSGHDACIIQLGVNDALNNVSEADMDAALTSIVTKVKNENNGIKIFIATIIAANGYMTATMRTRSQMIRDFVSSLNDSNVYLVDLWTYGRTDDYLAYDAGHLSALGYLRLAEDYKAYISYIIHNNPNDFRYVQFIGTNYTYSADSSTRGITY